MKVVLVTWSKSWGADASPPLVTVNVYLTGPTLKAALEAALARGDAFQMFGTT